MKIASPRRNLLIRWITLTCVVMFAAPIVAAEPAEPAAPSLKLVPQDASFYAAALRLREQFDIVVDSNWWDKIQQTEQYQQAIMMWEFSKTMDPNGLIAQLEVALQDPANEQLSEVLVDMVSDEVFFYGDDFTDAVEVFQNVSNAVNQATYARMAMIQAGNFGDEWEAMDDPQFMARAALKAVSENLDKLKTPEFVIGFRLKEVEAAEEQLQRLEAFARVMLEMTPEAAILRGKLKRKKIGGSEFLTLTLDGGMIPWNEFPLDEIAEEPGQFDAFKKHIESQKLVISLGIHKGYVLLSVGPSLDHIEKLGTGESLADAARLAPLRAMGGERFTSVSFVSEALMRSLTLTDGDFDNLAAMATALLPMAEITDEFQQALLADIPELKKDIVQMLPQPGDVLSFSFLNGRGYEFFNYDWGSNQLFDSSKPLPILEHLGGKPILALAGRGVDRPEDYDLLVKWLSKAKQYFDEHIVETMTEADQEAYKQIAEVAYPALKKADKINRDLLLPSLADGQCALVVDGLSTSGRWHVGVPAYDREMPMPLPALVLGLSDADKFMQAIQEYKSLTAATLTKLSELAPDDVPPVEIPDAQKETFAGGLTVYSYPLSADLGFDDKVAPNLGVSEKFAVFSLLPEQALRLAKAQPLISESGPLTNSGRPMCLAIYFDFHAMLDIAQPWIEEGVGDMTRSMAEMRAQFGDEEDFDEDAVSDEVTAALEVVDLWIGLARALHGFSSATFEEDGATITHAELHIEDVE